MTYTPKKAATTSSAGMVAVDVSDSDSEAEYVIGEADFLYVAGKVNQRNEDYCVYVMVYDSERDIQFERQSIPLSHSPLSLSWMDFSPSGHKGSYAAVSTMLPCVEIFDLDQVEELRSVCCLGGATNVEDRYTLDPEKPVALLPDSHKASILSIDWNTNEPSVLATGSADTTIKLWDMNTSACMSTIREHGSEVLSVRWHPQDRNLLLSSGLKDKGVVLTHASRQQETQRWDTGATAECAVWHPTQPALFVTGTADGHLKVFDMRKTGPPLYSFRPHPNGECNVITFSPHIDGLIATGSTDRHIALWDVRRGHREIVRRELGVGEVFALEFSPNNPFLLLGGGSAAQELVWTITDDIRDCGFRLTASSSSTAQPA